jgi:nitrile hydratase accessory protein
VSGGHGPEILYDPEAGFHPSCVADSARPTFDTDWQRRAFGLAVALSEFGHYRWEDFQRELIGAIGRWEDAPADERSRWEYYERWVDALGALVRDRGLLDEDYVMPEDREPGPTLRSGHEG